MTNQKRDHDWELQEHYVHRVEPALSKAPWVLRITEHKGKPVPVLILKEYVSPNGDQGSGSGSESKGYMEERGLIYGQPLRRCLPVFQTIISQVKDHADIPMELERFLSRERITFRGNLPLNEESGVKLGLIFKLRERIQEMDRVELIARRVERFTREEAAYWYSRMTNFGEDANRWARAGMRLMLGGQPGDPAVEPMLEELRSSY